MYKFLFVRLLMASLLICSVGSMAAQRLSTAPLQAPKRELRAAWVATVANIDYPKSPSTDPIALKEQYKNMLDQLQSLGMNAVIVQVRPAGDALYPSAHAPWSAYLTGRQGNPPKDNFDPLAFMIAETRARSMEFHAWINPFRASMNMDSSQLFLSHPVFTHPDWLLAYGGKMYFNPGIPAVRSHLVDVVGELVDNYDLDGIHIDDYFYPYPIKDTPFPDEHTFNFYGKPIKDINEWRRNNTDQLVEALHQRIKEARPACQFGVSPFGVWRNKSKDPARGSDTRAGATSYDDLHADVLKWMDRGWIDYVMPQLYWHIGFEAADHQKLVQWWSQNARETTLYVGHSAYKVGDNKEQAWNDPAEIPRQIDLNRRNFQTQGSAFFSTKSILANPLRLKDSLRYYYQTPALWVENPDLEAAKLLPVNMRRARWRKESVELRWKPGKDLLGASKPAHYYVVYRFEGQSVGDLENPANIRAITPLGAEHSKKFTFYDDRTKVGETYTYLVTAVNRGHQESQPSQAVAVQQKASDRIKNVRQKGKKAKTARTKVRRRDLRKQ